MPRFCAVAQPNPSRLLLNVYRTQPEVGIGAPNGPDHKLQPKTPALNSYERWSNLAREANHFNS
jgi:hypothetical protein